MGVELMRFKDESILTLPQLNITVQGDHETQELLPWISCMSILLLCSLLSPKLTKSEEENQGFYELELNNMIYFPQHLFRPLLQASIC
jgi:hypothetical protein